MKWNTKYLLIICLILIGSVFISAELPTQITKDNFTIINDSKITDSSFTIELKDSPEVIWIKEGDSYTPEYKDDSKYIIALDGKTGKVISKDLKPISNVTFTVNKISEEECSSSFYSSSCIETKWDFSDFENKNDITDKTITNIYPEGWDGWWYCANQEGIFDVPDILRCMDNPLAYDITYSGNIIDLDPVLTLTYSSTSAVVHLNQTEATDLGMRLRINTSATDLLDSARTPLYNYSSGDFKSLVFYNSTSTYWNTTLSLADSDGSADVYDLCNGDANCVSYWDLDDTVNGILDNKGSNDGTATGTNNATGISSGAVRFDGVGDYMSISGNPVSLQILSDVTISAWINPKDLTVPNYIISKYDSGANLRGFALGFDSVCAGTNEVYFVISESVDSFDGGALCSNALPSTDSWYYITAVFDSGSHMTIYVNGVNDTKGYAAGSVPSSIANSTRELAVGATYSNSATPDSGVFNGLIDEVLIYNDSLTASEVEELYKAGLSQHANTNISLETRTATSYNISDSGLVSFWGLNGNSIDEKGINNGTDTGVVYNEGNGTVGEGSYFDGVDDGIDLGTSSSLNPTTEMTLSGWINPDSLSDARYMIGRDISGNRAYAFGTNGDDLELQINGAATIRDQGITLSTGTWYHIVATGDSSIGWKTYVNGVEDGNASWVAPDSVSENTYIGRRGYVGAEGFFNGAIDEVRIYNRSLSAAEIQNLYELGSYHIEWTAWQVQDIVEDLTPQGSSGQGNFFQMKPVFTTNDTDVSPYVLNHSIGAGSQWGGAVDNPPYWLEEPSDLSVLDNETIYEINNVTDDNGVDTCWLNDTTMITANTTNIYNTSALSIGTYSYNLTCNDTIGQTNSTFFTVEVNTSVVYTCGESWSGTGTIGDACLVDTCGTILLNDSYYELQNSLTSNGTCLTANVENTTILGASYSITGNTTGIGINASSDDFDYLRKLYIQNITITNFTESIAMDVLSDSEDGGLLTMNDSIVENVSLIHIDVPLDISGNAPSFLGDNITFDTITTSVGLGDDAGASGTITLTSSAGTTVDSSAKTDITSTDGGDANTITLTDTTVVNAYAFGGNVSDTFQGGNGGNIYLINSYAENIDAIGGYEYSGIDGNGGNLYLTNSVLALTTPIDLSGRVGGTDGSIVYSNGGFNNSFGQIEIFSLNTKNWTITSIMNISNNSAIMESTTYPDYNVSANVTLYGIGDRGFTVPTILKDGIACTDCYNFTSLIAETVIFNVTSWTNYSIGDGSSAPTNPTPVLLSNDGLNSTMADLNCTSILTDDNGDAMNLTVKWYKDDILNLTNDFYDLTSGTNFVDNLSVGNLTIGDVWKCGMNLSDGVLSSDQVNSTALTIIKQNTSLLGVKFDLPDFTFDDTDYTLQGSFQFNTSDPNISMVILSSFNLKNAVGGTGDVDVWGKIFFDGVEIHEEELANIVWLGGDTDIASTGFQPINFTATSSGEHNISLYTKEVTINNKPVTMYNVEVSMGKFDTTQNNSINGSVQSFTTSVSSQTLVSVYNFSVERTYPSGGYHSVKLNYNASAETNLTCKLEHIGEDDVRPYTSGYLSGATDTGDFVITFIEIDEESSHNVSLSCLSTSGADVDITGKFIDFALRDNGGYFISANQSSNSSTNITNTISLGAGEHVLTNQTLTFNAGGDSAMISATATFQSLSGENTPVFSINSSIGADCYTEIDRHIHSNDRGEVFIYVICKNSPAQGETHWITLSVSVPAGESIDVLDESLNSFEIQSFDTVTLNTAPNIVVLNPEEDESVYGTYNITWISSDIQSNPFLQNITLNNGTDYIIQQDLSQDIQNYLWDTTAYANGDYNLTISVCENDTADLLCANDTNAISIHQIPIVNITSPVNGSTYTTSLMDLIYTVDGFNISTCYFNNNDAPVNLTIPGCANEMGIAVVEGENTFTVWAEDANGLFGSDSVTFTIDLPCVFTSLYPQDGINTTQVSVANATATDTQGSCTINYSVGLIGNTSYSSPFYLSLPPNSYTMDWWATDSYGSITNNQTTFLVIDNNTGTGSGSNPTMNCSADGNKLLWNTTAWLCVNETDPLWSSNYTDFLALNSSLFSMNTTLNNLITRVDALNSTQIGILADISSIQSNITDIYLNLTDLWVQVNANNISIYEINSTLNIQVTRIDTLNSSIIVINNWIDAIPNCSLSEKLLYNGTGFGCFEENNTQALYLFVKDGSFEVETNITLEALCMYKNGSICSNETDCFLTVNYPNKTNYLINQTMLYNESGIYRYNIGYTGQDNESIKGDYLSQVLCQEGVFSQVQDFVFNVYKGTSYTAGYSGIIYGEDDNMKMTIERETYRIPKDIQRGLDFLSIKLSKENPGKAKLLIILVFIFLLFGLELIHLTKKMGLKKKW